MSRSGAAAGLELDLLMNRASIQLVPVDAPQVERARWAFRRFGRGQHPAALNFGDCFSYALAMERHLPLLFKGNAFSRTDVEAAS